MVFRFECDLEEAAKPFLIDNGFIYSKQVPLYNRVIDLVAIDPNGHVIGIEFKLTDWKRALKQAIANSNSFDFVYICLPGGTYIDRLRDDAMKHGVGVMVYDDDIGTIRIDLPAKKIVNQWEPNISYIKKYIREELSIEYNN